MQNIWQKYKIEAILITTSLLIVFISILIFIKSAQIGDEELLAEEPTVRPSNIKMYVDIAGAVVKPDTYRISPGARLKDMLILAGGLSDSADRNFFARNFNLARFVNDQEKIYVPFAWEIYLGIFTESQRILDYTKPALLAEENTAEGLSITTDNEKININIATLSELDQLPGVGKVTAQKIIQNRPYASLDELLSKKAVGKSVFEKIKDLISVN